MVTYMNTTHVYFIGTGTLVGNLKIDHVSVDDGQGRPFLNRSQVAVRRTITEDEFFSISAALLAGEDLYLG